MICVGRNRVTWLGAAAVLPFGAGCRKAYTTNIVSRRYAYISAARLLSMNRLASTPQSAYAYELGQIQT